eukprot:TRINITY_DN6157_c0_g1_i1.p1 TRINITY_DN6157_c0_g1~~TRINITY_DN6157_c0_g1_i1.p1  ORF type:complete len:351 (+),score=115.82 TRINITY_DN6157_c0_g1_i1:73-1125(+)
MSQSNADAAVAEMLRSKLSELELQKAAAVVDESFERQTKRDIKELKTFTQSPKTADEKIAELLSRASAALTLVNKKHQELMALKSKNETLLQEKDALVSQSVKEKERTAKIEGLCRELQRQNKAVMEEAKAIRDAEQQRRQELSDKFTASLQDISSQMEEHTKEREAIVAENSMLREKLRALLTQFEAQEQHTSKLLQTKDLEKQLLEVKLGHAEEILKQQGAKVEVESKMQREALEAFVAREGEYRKIIEEYKDRFTQIQSVMEQNAEQFNTLKTRLQTTIKRAEKAEKENASLQQQTADSKGAILKYIAENESLKKEKEKLAGLSRTLNQKLKDTEARLKTSETQAEQ